VLDCCVFLFVTFAFLLRFRFSFFLSFFLFFLSFFNRMGSADFPQTGEVIIIISSRLLLPMIPSVSILMTWLISIG